MVSFNNVKRERWAEADVAALPAGEHDYFERKSGALFRDNSKLFGALAKALSAFANSGGGHIVLGVRNDGSFDGVPRLVGNTSVRDWLEQKLPHLVQYPLYDFRVHVVVRGEPSSIPNDTDLIVIDVNDSAAAPHQCAFGGEDASKFVYYYRQAGRSEPAPHFYLELLRNRSAQALLRVNATGFKVGVAGFVNDKLFVGIRLWFDVENSGRVITRNWGLILEDAFFLSGHDSDVVECQTDWANWPIEPELDIYAAIIPLSEANRVILPGCAVSEHEDIGATLDIADLNDPTVFRRVVQEFVDSLHVMVRTPTETSPGEPQQVDVRAVLDPDALAAAVLEQLHASRRRREHPFGRRW